MRWASCAGPAGQRIPTNVDYAADAGASMFLLLAACAHPDDPAKPTPGDTPPPDDTAPACTATSWSPDTDGDSFGDAAAPPVEACEAPEGHVADATDCDDTDGAVHPGATEVCDGLDTDCDGLGDDATATWYVDADGDGYGDPAMAVDSCAPDAGHVADGTDCDDTDALVNPGAEEQCDGDDDNCDGVADLVEVQEWHTDTDGDGYGHPYNYEVTCDPPAGSVLDDNDCRPGDAEAYPGAAERCNEDDDDCDGEVDEGMDQDGDGHRSDACEDGDDCDDTEPDAWPGNDEACGDTIDQDCDGFDLTCGFIGAFELGADADAELYAHASNYDAGRQLALGDATGDGVEDLLVATLYADSYGGGGYLVSGLHAGAVDLGSVAPRISGTSALTYGAGRSIGVADVDGDAVADIGFGAPYGNFPGMYLELGPILEDRDIASSPDVWLERPASEYCGHGADLGDLNADGYADGVVGCYAARTSAGPTGGVYIAYGPFAEGESRDLDASPDVTIEGEAVSGYAGRWVRAGADFDGDGTGDLLVAAPYVAGSGPSSGAVYVVYGPPSDMSLASADGVFVGDDPGEILGEGIGTGDVNGDGLADVLACAPADSTYATNAGGAFVFFGPASGAEDTSTADVAIFGDETWASVGYGIDAADADGDGRGDLLFGGYMADVGGTDFGVAYFFSGPTPGTYLASEAQATFAGESNGSMTGLGVAIGDLDADGYGELYVGAPGEDSGGSQAGSVYMVLPDL